MHLFEFMNNTLHRQRYEGARRDYPYFEGWYYKLIDTSEEHRYAVIPGIYRGPDGESSHATRILSHRRQGAKLINPFATLRLSESFPTGRAAPRPGESSPGTDVPKTAGR